MPVIGVLIMALFILIGGYVYMQGHQNITVRDAASYSSQRAKSRISPQQASSTGAVKRSQPANATSPATAAQPVKQTSTAQSSTGSSISTTTPASNTPTQKKQTPQATQTPVSNTPAFNPQTLPSFDIVLNSSDEQSDGANGMYFTFSFIRHNGLSGAIIPNVTSIQSQTCVSLQSISMLSADRGYFDIAPVTCSNTYPLGTITITFTGSAWSSATGPIYKSTTIQYTVPQ